jgi:hypothetical protein
MKTKKLTVLVDGANAVAAPTRAAKIKERTMVVIVYVNVG